MNAKLKKINNPFKGILILNLTNNWDKNLLREKFNVKLLQSLSQSIRLMEFSNLIKH